MQAFAVLQRFSFIVAPLLSQLHDDLSLHQRSMTTSWPPQWMQAHNVFQHSASPARSSPEDILSRSSTQDNSAESSTDPTCSSSSSSSRSYSPSSSALSAVPVAASVSVSVSPGLARCGVLHLSVDLLAHTSRFLSISELLHCSGLSRWLHSVFDSDRVWRRRLTRALHIQSSYIPLEIQPPYTEDDDDGAQDSAALPGELHERKELERLLPMHAALPAVAADSAPPPAASSSSATSPSALSLAQAADLCLAYYTRRINPNNHLRCDITAAAILPAPADSFPPPKTWQRAEESESKHSHSAGGEDDLEEGNDNEEGEEEEEAEQASPTSVSSPASASAVGRSSSQSLVYHAKMLLSRSATVNKTDCRAFAILPLEDGSGWEVERMGVSDSGRLVLNVLNIRNLHEPAASPSSALPASASCKRRYIALLTCSAHESHRCHTLVAPSPSLPPPRPIPAWFSHHLAQLAFRHQPFPPIPALPFPAFHPLPLCVACRVSVARALRRWGRARHEELEFSWQVDCVVRVNRWEWDVRWREYADEITYRRCIIAPAVAEDQHEWNEDSMDVSQPGHSDDGSDSDGQDDADADDELPDCDTARDGDDEQQDDDDDDDDDEDGDGDEMMPLQPQPSSVPVSRLLSSQYPSGVSVPGRSWRVERVMVDEDSGVYAVNHDSNIHWTNPTPPSPFTTHPPVSQPALHSHPLYHHARSVYRNGDYVCDVCTAVHRDERAVWHCPHCHFDVCEQQVSRHTGAAGGSEGEGRAEGEGEGAEERKEGEGEGEEAEQAAAPARLDEDEDEGYEGITG